MIIPLKKSELFNTVIPSKIFETSAMQVPIMLGVDGEAREIVESYQAGIYFEPENECDFNRVLDIIKNSAHVNETLKQGCLKLAHDFDRKRLAKELLNEIRSII